MKVLDEINSRISELLAQVPALLQQNKYDQVDDARVRGASLGWIVAGVNVVQIACTSAPNSSYLAQARHLQQTASAMGFQIHHDVLAFAELLKQLRTDIDRGFLVTIERQVSAETYDNLMDHAEAYLSDGKKDPAGVIAGVIFEDTIRRLCRENRIDDAGKTSEPLINALTTAGVLTKLESKEAKAASDLRANATHALWDKFNKGQVRAVIDFTRRLLRDKLAA